MPQTALRERLVLAGICVAAAVCYSWGVAQMQLHLYYGPGVLTMSESWAAWLSGAYDSLLATTFDKVPGTFWLQSLSARVFGYSSWSVLLPSLLASVAAVLLLYRIVNRWAGPAAGLAAAGFYAATPLVAALARTQIPDPLLVALLLAAVATWQVAIANDRLAPLLYTGLWVGLAFQAKMAQAWLVFVPLGLTYLIYAPGGWSLRLRRLLLAGAVSIAVSLAWVLPMALIPASSRPWVDGSVDNSVWSMVFGYNGFNRYGLDNAGAEALGIGGPPGRPEGPAWLYLLRDGVAPQVGWLYPLALAGLVAGLWVAAHRTVTVMWALWFAVHAVAFAVSVKAHTFYNLALAPVLAAFAAVGLYHLAKAYQGAGWRRWLLPLSVAATVGWAWHLAGRFPSFAPWLPQAVAVTGAVAVLALVVGALAPHARAQTLAPQEDQAQEPVAAVPAMSGAVPPYSPMHSRSAGADLPRRMGPDSNGGGHSTSGGGLWRAMAVATGVAAMLIAPVTWTLSVTDNLSVSDAHRPAAGPVSRETASILSGRLPRMLPGDEVDRIASHVKANNAGERYEIAVQWAPQAGQFVLRGIAALPIGGFTAQVPNVQPSQLREWAESGQLRYALVDGPELKGKPTPDYPDYSVWVRQNCKPVSGFDRPLYILYDCG